MVTVDRVLYETFPTTPNSIDIPCPRDPTRLDFTPDCFQLPLQNTSHRPSRLAKVFQGNFPSAYGDGSNLSMASGGFLSWLHFVCLSCDTFMASGSESRGVPEL